MQEPHARWLVAGALVTALIGAAATELPAQTVGAQVIFAHSGHHLLGNLRGGSVLLGFPLRDRRLSVTLQGERITGSTHREGTVCGSFTPPPGCPVENLRITGESTGGAIGLEYQHAMRPAVTLGILGRARFAALHAVTRGTVTGQRLSASKAVWGGEAGGWLGLSARSDSPLSLEIGAALGFHTPFKRVDFLDGYTPFDGDSTMARVWLGIRWRVGPR